MYDITSKLQVAETDVIGNLWNVLYLYSSICLWGIMPQVMVNSSCVSPDAVIIIIYHL